MTTTASSSFMVESWQGARWSHAPTAVSRSGIASRHGEDGPVPDAPDGQRGRTPSVRGVPRTARRRVRLPLGRLGRVVERGPTRGKADFVITHPELGLLALEVKGGRIAYDPRTKRWTQTGHSGTHDLDEDPFHQAKGAMHSLVRILQGRPGWERWQPSYGFGLAFPDGRYERPAHPGAPVEIVIDRSDLARLAERVPEVMRTWSRPGRRFGAEGMEAVSMALGFRVEIRTPLKLRFDEEDKKIVELTSDQAWVLAFVLHRRRAAVTGPAGSGKTLLAISVAKQTRRRRSPNAAHVLQPDWASIWPSVGDVDGIDVATFHQLCAQMAREAGIELPPEDAEPSSPYFEHRLPEALAEAAARLGPRYDAIVVDEAQDFREWWWPALLSLHTDPEAGPLYVFADDNQNLYGGTLPVDEEDRVGPIALNLRNTKEIGEFVSVFYRGTSSRSLVDPRATPFRSWATTTTRVWRGCSRWCSRTWSRRSTCRSRTSWCSHRRARRRASEPWDGRRLPVVRVGRAGHGPRDQRPRVQGPRAACRDPRRARRQAPGGSPPVPVRRCGRGPGTTSSFSPPNPSLGSSGRSPGSPDPERRG